jgi:hypothetical protein
MIMGSSEKNSVIVELYDLPLTERKDDRFGRVVTTKSLIEDDLVNIAVSRRTDLSATTLKAAIEILKEIAIEQIANGASVRFGLGYFHLAANGVFIGDNARWDPELHCLVIKVSPTMELRVAIENCQVSVRGMAQVGVVVNSVIDVSSGEENARLTPGGGVNLSGNKIKITGDDANVGLKLINQATQAETIIPETSILVNEPSKVTFIVPAGLASGDYKLSLTTQFTQSNTNLIEPRSCVFDYVLNVT